MLQLTKPRSVLTAGLCSGTGIYLLHNTPQSEYIFEITKAGRTILPGHCHDRHARAVPDHLA
ncbi:MAG: hypothetical protein EOP49_42685 [Sphingobacteriales bacterium]|nr:MAG: hypothetical protein EOP49_42685 [Sphingobacteriales bacterium]